MLEKIPYEFHNLHFDTLTLSPFRVNWVERWMKAKTILFIRPMMCISFTKDGKTHPKDHTMVFRSA
jgi:hypothetical protein